MATKATNKAPAKQPTVKQTNTVRATTNKGGTVFADDQQVKLNVTENPKRGASRERFNGYFTMAKKYPKGFTVAQVLAETEVTRADLRWDANPKRALITIA